MSSRVTPAESAGQVGSSGRSMLLSLPTLRNRRQSVVKENILQNGMVLRRLAHATKIFQSELEGFFEKCNDLSYKMLETLVKTEFKVGTLWAKAYLTKWRPTRENKRLLAKSTLQSCMIYLRSESIGRPDPRTVLKTFGASVVLDLFEFVAVANIFVFFFYLNEATAGWVLLGCLIFERVLQVLGSLALENISITSVLASLLGFKTFLTSYFIACLGPFGKVDGSKVNLITSRLVQKGVNIIFLLAPQALLNAYSVFSKLKTGKAITSTMRIQIFVVLAVCFSAAASLTKLQQESDAQRAKKGHYKSMTQILSKDSDQLGMAILKGGWNICHLTLVTCALGALMAKTPPYVWISIIVGFFFILNAVRYIINKGEMRFFLRVESFGAIFIPGIVFVFGVGLMPLSVLRWHCTLGPTVYGVGWISSFLISSISLIYLSSDLFLRIVFGVLIGVYVVIVLSYFRYLKPEARTTFFWSKETWKDILSTEWWDNPHYESWWWEDIHLIGDKDANCAAMIRKFLNADLPWEKLLPWLKEKKTSFKDNPPTWLSEEWLKLIPETRRNEVWNQEEYLELCETIRRAEATFRRTNLRNNLFLEHTDDEEIQNNDQEKEKEKERRLPEDEEIALQQQQERNAIRQKVIENIKKRRSSFMGSLQTIPITNDSEEKDIPEKLKKIFAKSEFLKIDEIVQESKLVLNNGLLDILLGPQENASAEDIVLMILKAFLCERKKQKKKENITEGVPRILLAAFFELFDEVSDIILASLFYADTDNKRWAGHLMFVFMGLNRLVQGLFSLSCGESKWRVCEGFIGIKCITDTYRMIRDGPTAMTGGLTLVTSRAFSLGIGMTCESLPQMM
eukprot:g457.t1